MLGAPRNPAVGLYQKEKVAVLDHDGFGDGAGDGRSAVGEDPLLPFFGTARP
jgi:hypothetical protein